MADERPDIGQILGRIKDEKPITPGMPKGSPEDWAPRREVLKHIPIEVSFQELVKLEEFNRQQLADSAAKLAPNALEDILTRIKEIRAVMNDVIAKAKASGEWYE